MIDIRSRKVCRNGENVHLTPKEYAVIGVWWGAVANAALLALLLATATKWMPRPRVADRQPPADPSKSPAGSLPTTTIVVLLVWG